MTNSSLVLFPLKRFQKNSFRIQIFWSVYFSGLEGAITDVSMVTDNPFVAVTVHIHNIFGINYVTLYVSYKNRFAVPTQLLVALRGALLCPHS